MVGCGTTSGKPLSTAEPKHGVAAVQVLDERSSTVIHLGICLKTAVDDENRVYPESGGDGVTPAKNWNLRFDS